MIRSGLTFVLVAFQLLSWSSHPLYLCLGSDGSVDVCFGPGHCDCERGGHHEAAYHDADHVCCSCQHEQHSHLPVVVRTPVTSDCDCTHLQITRAIAPTMIGKAITTDNHENSLPAIPIGNLLAELQANAAIFNRGKSFSRGDASPLAHLSTVALRC